MAIQVTAAAASSAENPQDPSYDFPSSAKNGDGEEKEFDKSSYNKKKRRLVHLIRRQVLEPRRLVVTIVIALVSALSCHRIVSLYVTHRKWMNAPITYLSRECPAPVYKTMVHPEERAGRICLTTLTDSKARGRTLQKLLRWRNFDTILDLTWKNKENYAAKHGYDLYDGSHLLELSRPPAWTKILALKDLLENKNCDWAMWLDADTVIMNSDIRIESFLPDDDTKDMIIASDNGYGYNSGVIVFRNTEWSRSFINKWWNMKSFMYPPGFALSGDNYALKTELRELEDFDKHVVVPPRCTMNSFATFLTLQQSVSVVDSLSEQEWYMSQRYYHKGDFIAHTPGYDNKEECLRLLLNEAK